MSNVNNKSSITEGEFIQESTLIAASELILVNESIQIQATDPNSQTQQNSQNLGSVNANNLTANDVKKNNNTLIIGGVVGALILGAGAFMLTTKGDAPKQNTPVVKDVKKNLEPPAASAQTQAEITRKIEVPVNEEFNSPITPEAISNETAEKTGLSIDKTVGVDPISASSVISEAKVEQAPADKNISSEKLTNSDSKVTLATEKELNKSDLNNLSSDKKQASSESLNIKDQIKTEEGVNLIKDIELIKQRLDKLESNGEKLFGQDKESTSVNSGSIKRDDIKPIEKNRNSSPNSLTAEQREKAARKKAEKSAEKAAYVKEKNNIDSEAKKYSIHATKDNLVWLKKGGEVKVYSIGDNVPGVGLLTGVDVISGSAMAAGRIIR